MKTPQDTTHWFYVDESGDPVFYGKGGSIIVGQQGCSRAFLIGFIRTENRDAIHNRLTEVRQKIVEDRYLVSIPSVAKSRLAFHAKDDCPEVRMLVYQALAELDFEAQVIVARKSEQMFRSRYKGSQDLFYDDLVSRLFENSLHRAIKNEIIFSRRGNRSRQHALRAAIQDGIERFRKKWKTDVSTQISVSTQQPSQESCLQVIDYANWAVQRAYEKGEMRYFEFLRSKFACVIDVFDKEKYKSGANFYGRTRNPFDIKKASPLG